MQAADGYLRIQTHFDARTPPGSVDQGLPAKLWPPKVDGLLFIDVEPGREPWHEHLEAGLRYAGEGACADADVVLARASSSGEQLDPQMLASAAAYIGDRWESAPTVGAVLLQPGSPGPDVVWLNDDDQTFASDESRAQILARARAIEVRALLENGKALWTPAGYHYVLPNGQHRTTFVRLADAIRQPRDAEALAWWLLPHFVHPNRALVLDSSSLLPLVFALRNALSDAGIVLGNVGVRDAYPETPLEDQALFDHIGGEGIVAVLSVSSSGTTADSWQQAMRARRASGEWRLETIVSRVDERASAWDVAATGDVAEWPGPWCTLPFGPDRDLTGEPYLMIDPQTLANTIIPEPAIRIILYPPTTDSDIKDLLAMYDEVDGIGVECDLHPSTALRRGRERSAVRFFTDRLLQSRAFVHAAQARLQGSTSGFEDGRPQETMSALRGIDAVVFEASIEGLPGFEDYLDMVVGELADDPAAVAKLPIPSEPGDGDSVELATRLGSAAKVLVLGLGLVTGRTMQRLHIRVLQAAESRGDPDVEVVGLAVHARPASFEEWKSARSAFWGHLAALWVTYLPWDSPLREEAAVLSRLGEAEREEVEGFVSMRMGLINSTLGDWHERTSDYETGYGAANPRAIMWCAEQDSDDLPRLLSGSRFGENASMLAVYVGVAAAMHRERQEQVKKGGPPWVRFDLTKTNFTYFESPIHAAVLRWLRPAEALWNSDSKTPEYVVREMWDQAREEGLRAQMMILAELLLAASQGKVPQEVFPVLAQLVDELGQEAGHVPAPIAGGALLLDQVTRS